MVVMVTPEVKVTNIIPRIKVTAEDIAKVGRIPIHYCKDTKAGLSSITYKTTNLAKADDPSVTLEILWKSSILFGKPRPSWSRTMEFVHNGSHPGKSSVIFLPMIDMNPSDPSCIYSTLHYVANHARKFNSTPILTLDQPLWWKAYMITLAEPEDSPVQNFVLRLGGLHQMMSFLGSMGIVMGNSGLKDVLETVYAPNSVEHMMSGKAIFRAVRGNSLVESVLSGMVLSNTLQVLFLEETDQSSDNDQAKNSDC